MCKKPMSKTYTVPHGSPYGYCSGLLFIRKTAFYFIYKWSHWREHSSTLKNFFYIQILLQENT